MTDVDVINKIISIDNLPLYGTYHRDAIARICAVSTEQIGALTRFGLIDLDVQPVYGVTNAYNYYYTFNSRWRIAKTLGSYEALLNYENEQEIKEREKEQLEFNLIKSQNDFQLLNNQFIVKQGELIQDQIDTNANVKATNGHIVTNNTTVRVILWVTVGVTAINLIPASFSVVHDFKKDYSEDTIMKKQMRIELLEKLQIQKESQIDSLKTILLKKEAKPLGVGH